MFLWGDSLPGSWFADFPDKVAFFNILPLESLAYCSGSRGAWEKGLRASPLAPGTLRVSSRHSPGSAFHGLPWLLGQVLDKLLPLCGLQSRVRRFGVCGRDSHSLRLGFSLGEGKPLRFPLSAVPCWRGNTCWTLPDLFVNWFVRLWLVCCYSFQSTFGQNWLCWICFITKRSLKSRPLICLHKY